VGLIPLPIGGGGSGALFRRETRKPGSIKLPGVLTPHAENSHMPIRSGLLTKIGARPKIGSRTGVVLSNKEKVARAGLVRERTPPQCVRDEFFGGDIPQCRSALVS
jgi:hypothetical protein